MSMQIVEMYAVTNILRTYVIGFRPIHDNICNIVTYVEFQPITYLIIHIYIGRAACVSLFERPISETSY